ncbi:thioredoxin domain-containing protein [Enterococcus faecalis]|uniref:thioredoxin domain-containing protein n=1 Tax=Enterococcus faecalis TaxID=1351 RepID=UPI003A8F34A8
MNPYGKFISEKYLKRRKIVMIFLLLLCLVFVSSCTKRKQMNTFTETNLDTALANTEQPKIIYFSKEGCPDCDKMNQFLTENETMLTYPVQKIELTKEKNQTKLKQLLSQHNIKTVPSFLLIKNQKRQKVELKKTKNSIQFLRLNQD